jgi:hypothetical protein
MNITLHKTFSSAKSQAIQAHSELRDSRESVHHRPGTCFLYIASPDLIAMRRAGGPASSSARRPDPPALLLAFPFRILHIRVQTRVFTSVPGAD